MYQVFYLVTLLNFQYNTVKYFSIIYIGTGLAFVVYPEAISKMPLPTVWAILFFFMMLIIGFSSEVKQFNLSLHSLFPYYNFSYNFHLFILFILIWLESFSLSSQHTRTYVYYPIYLHYCSKPRLPIQPVVTGLFRESVFQESVLSSVF